MHATLLTLTAPANGPQGGDARAANALSKDQGEHPDFAACFGALVVAGGREVPATGPLAKPTGDVDVAEEDAADPVPPETEAGIKIASDEADAPDPLEVLETEPRKISQGDLHPDRPEVAETAREPMKPEIVGIERAVDQRDHTLHGRTTAAEATTKLRAEQAQPADRTVPTRPDTPAPAANAIQAAALVPVKARPSGMLPHEAIISQGIAQPQPDHVARDLPLQAQGNAIPAVPAEQVPPRLPEAAMRGRTRAAEVSAAPRVSREARISAEAPAPIRPPLVANARPSTPEAVTTRHAATTEGASLLQPTGDRPVEIAWDQTRPSVVTGLPPVHRPETPVMIARQMAEALHRAPDRPVELTLNPEELGRVRLSITSADMGITVNVLAERMETLDLMRRHIDQLAEEFRSMGYEDINFSFGEGAQGTGSNDSASEDCHPAELIALEADPAAIPQAPAYATSGLDIRL